MKIRKSDINMIIEREVNKRIKMIKEGEEAGFCPGGAYFTGGGGAYGPFQTLANTVGIGDPVPAGSGETLGSGDKFDKVIAKPAKKRGADDIPRSKA